jgi:hypothetical protein
MKPYKKEPNIIRQEVGMDAIYTINLDDRKAWLNVKWLGNWETILEFSFDEFYDLKKIKAKLEKKAMAYYTFLDS